MSALQLLFYIAAALLLQLAAGVSIAFLRWRRARRRGPLGTDTALPPASRAAWVGLRAFRIARRFFEDAARTQCSFQLEPVDGGGLPAFKPGQYLTIALNIAGGQTRGSVSERVVTRCYSLSDRPRPSSYRITVKRVLAPPDRPDLPTGLASNELHDRVREGDVLMVKAPAGRFFINADPDVPVVLVAGGIGITPMLSMLLWCAADQPDREIHLYYGVRNGAEHAFKGVLEELTRTLSRFHLTVVYSRPGPDDVSGRDYHHSGHVCIDLLKRTLPHGRHEFYVCGPSPMMESLAPALLAWGVSPEDIHYEAFGPASIRQLGGGAAADEPDASAGLSVRFRRSGRTLVWERTDANLLEFAERNGIAIVAGCRAGSCGSCETRIVSGAVRYGRTPDHDIAPAHCLLCIGIPQSALELDA